MLIKLYEAYTVGDQYTDRHDRAIARTTLEKRERYVNPDNVVDVHLYTWPQNYLTEEASKRVGERFSRVITTRGDFIVCGSPTEVAEQLGTVSKELLKG